MKAGAGYVQIVGLVARKAEELLIRSTSHCQPVYPSQHISPSFYQENNL